MRRVLTTLLLMPAMVLGALLTGVTTAQTPVASPVAGGWAVTDVREIAVEGEPIALSPDGQWLAGTADDGNAVCAWDVETLTPTCADVDAPVLPILGGMALRWAPDSSAFAFASGDRTRFISGNVMVFEMESGELVNLTGSDATDDGPVYLGVDWTADSSQVIFVDFDTSGDPDARDTLFRIDRGGGGLVQIPLPTWSEKYAIFTPPLAIGNDAVLVTIESSGDAGGVWRIAFDGTDPEKVVSATGPNAISRPLVASVSDDGRYASVVSHTRMVQFETEDTYFIADLVSEELVPLEPGFHNLLVTFAPGGDTGLTVRDDRLATVDPVTGGIQPVANSPEVELWATHVPVWATDDTVFLPGEGGGTLVALSPAA